MSTETVAIRMGFRPDQALALERACIEFGIDTVLRKAHFLGQTAHESGTGRWMNEIWGPTPAQRRYEGRKDLGNVEPGDGYRFRGRGLIQLTGRENYTNYSRDMYGDLRAVLNPDMLAQLPDAGLAAGWFWGPYKRLNKIADTGSVEAVTKRVNGGQNGLEDRRKKTQLALDLFAALTK